MIPIDIAISRSKVSVKGQAYSIYVGEGGHKCFTNIYILMLLTHATQAIKPFYVLVVLVRSVSMFIWCGQIDNQSLHESYSDPLYTCV